MPFNSYQFILIFLPVVLLGYYFLPSKFSKIWLLFSSLFFYGFYIPQNLIILLTSIVINFCIGKELLKKRSAILFYIGLILNLGALCFYKYSHPILPIGISFFTIQQIAYLVDVYQGLGKKHQFINYALFVSFFPHLLAGPIVKIKDMMIQYEKDESRFFNTDLFIQGIYLFTLGLAKKVLIADYFSEIAGPGFNEGQALDLLLAWKTSLAYTFQLYFDFSGYSDMAMALGLMFNIKIAQNFNSPLKALNIIDFWNRWHMTLSGFIRTYIFTPIAKALPSMDFAYVMVATFLSMVLAGIWHGAGWTYVVYGVLHGSALVINHLWKKQKMKMPVFMAWFLTFNFVNLSFVLFRATDLRDAIRVIKGMLGLSGVVVPKMFGIKSVGLLSSYGFSMGSLLIPTDYLLLIFVLSMFYILRKCKNTNELLREFKSTNKMAIYTSLLFVLSLFGLNRVTEFIYFNF